MGGDDYVIDEARGRAWGNCWDALNWYRDELNKLAPPTKPLTAAEVTEPGWYWWRMSDGPWTMASIRRDEDGDLLFATDADEFHMPHMPGTFIGPISPPRLP